MMYIYKITACDLFMFITYMHNQGRFISVLIYRISAAYDNVAPILTKIRRTVMVQFVPLELAIIMYVYCMTISYLLAPRHSALPGWVISEPHDCMCAVDYVCFVPSVVRCSFG